MHDIFHIARDYRIPGNILVWKLLKQINERMNSARATTKLSKIWSKTEHFRNRISKFRSNLKQTNEKYPENKHEIIRLSGVTRSAWSQPQRGRAGFIYGCSMLFEHQQKYKKMFNFGSS